MQSTVAVVACVICIAAILACFCIVKVSRTRLYGESVTCVMVTGKDESRAPLARLAAQNFWEQEWNGAKRLLVINHGPFSVASLCHGMPVANVIEEVQVKKEAPHGTLGALRNLALERVAPGALWAVWDDDDHRRRDYLSRLYSAIPAASKMSGLVSYTDRIEYNAQTGLVWRAKVPWGCVHVLARRSPQVWYDAHLDTLEDSELIQDHRAAGARVAVLDTSCDASHYIRVVHASGNTSPYVDAAKTALLHGQPGGYQELPASLQEQAAVAAWLVRGGAAALAESATYSRLRQLSRCNR